MISNNPSNSSSFMVPQNIYLPKTIGGDRLPAFVLKGHLFVLGNYGNKEAVFWKYDFSTSNWTRLENFPGGCRLYYNYFSNNDLGYVLFGSPLGYSATSPDIWTYIILIDTNNKDYLNDLERMHLISIFF